MLCYIYANCFGKDLKLYLEQIPEFTNIYNEIHYFYVVDCVSKIDLEAIKNCKLFLYQHVSAEALKDNSGRNLDISQYTSDSLVRILPKDAITISFPSPYFTAYFPYGVTLKDIPNENLRNQYPDHFPGYCFNRNLLEKLLQKEAPQEIANYLNNPTLYSREEILKNVSTTFSNLEYREIKNRIDIPLSGFIRRNYKFKRLFHTTNHPTKIIFEYVIERILSILNIPHSEIILPFDNMMKYARVPILSCVKRALELPENEDFNGSIYVNGIEIYSLFQYVKFYSDLFS